MCIFDLINLLPSARCTYVDRRAICIKTLSSIVNLNDKQKYCIQYVQCVSMNSKIAVTNKTHSCVNISTLIDPLGYLVSVIIAAKSLLKEVWSFRIERKDEPPASLDWDDPVPNQLAERWRQIIQELPDIQRYEGGPITRYTDPAMLQLL
nr:uncharacterized protein LOC118878992 isoform X1 [Drosophila suzukii]